MLLIPTSTVHESSLVLILTRIWYVSRDNSDHPSPLWDNYDIYHDFGPYCILRALLLLQWKWYYWYYSKTGEHNCFVLDMKEFAVFSTYCIHIFRISSQYHCRIVHKHRKSELYEIIGLRLLRNTFCQFSTDYEGLWHAVLGGGRQGPFTRSMYGRIFTHRIYQLLP